MNGTLLTAIGFSVVFVATTIGAAFVFFFKNDVTERQNALFTGFAAGIMVAASIFSLLMPSIESFSYLGAISFLPTAAGFIVGGLFFAVTEVFVRRVVYKNKPDFNSGASARPMKMFVAMTVHNLPEGLAVGFAFGSAAFGGEQELIAALMLAIGIAIQNFPEGAAVSLPMKSVVKSPVKAFAIGSLSGIVEPIAALLGYAFSTALSALLPYVMAFSAGTMVFVVIEDLLPTAGGNKLCSWGFMAGFAV